MTAVAADASVVINSDKFTVWALFEPVSIGRTNINTFPALDTPLLNKVRLRFMPQGTLLHKSGIPEYVENGIGVTLVWDETEGTDPCLFNSAAGNNNVRKAFYPEISFTCPGIDGDTEGIIANE